MCYLRQQGQETGHQESTLGSRQLHRIVIPFLASRRHLVVRSSGASKTSRFCDCTRLIHTSWFFTAPEPHVARKLTSLSCSQLR